MPSTRCMFGLFVTVLSWLLLLGSNAAPASTHVRHANNGVWLGHAYVTTPSYVEKVPALADDMQQHYIVRYWFVNVGTVDSAGHLRGGAGGLSQAVAFLHTLHGWETSHHHQF